MRTESSQRTLVEQGRSAPGRQPRALLRSPPASREAGSGRGGAAAAEEEEFPMDSRKKRRRGRMGFCEFLHAGKLG